MASNATLHDATTPPTTAAPLAAGILHLPITTDAEAFGRVASERVLVRLAEAEAEQRGSLARVVVAGIEAALEQLGAAPGGWTAADTLEEIARDQLYRARLLGYFGVALSFSPLTALADTSGRLSAEDSETLRRLLALAQREPLQLYLPRPSSELLIAGAPQPLATWLPASGVPGRVATIEYDPASAHQADTPLPPESGPGVALLPPPLDAFVDAAIGGSLVVPPTPPITADVAAARKPSASEQPAAADAPAPSRADLAPPAREQESAEATPLPAVAATDAERAERCAAWAAQLRGMSGPKVHGSIEKAFVTAYLPLRHELAVGAAPEQALKAAERWAEGFAQSYASAFRQLGASGRRPRMVRDVIELGSRWLGQYHARQCQLLLVSAMRFDLGQRLNEELERRLAGGGMCVDQSVLWTALPSNADAQQLGEAVGLARRGRQDPPQQPRLAALPGGSGPAIESGHVGSRELFRLRQLPDDLARPGEPEEARLRRLATELGAAIVPWMLRQPPDTLVVIFGDHGFHWDVSPSGTSAAQRGGALPEQVLVPASAWLLREPRPRPKTAPGVH